MVRKRVYLAKLQLSYVAELAIELAKDISCVFVPIIKSESVGPAVLLASPQFGAHSTRFCAVQPFCALSMILFCAFLYF